jgi:hypothetical protein
MDNVCIFCVAKYMCALSNYREKHYTNDLVSATFY